MTDDKVKKAHLDSLFPGAKNDKDGFKNHGFITPRSEAFKGHAGTLFINGQEPPPMKLSDPDRPLIDKLQEATFGDATPMQWVTDKYALRMLLRKAHCFTIDAQTSAMISDFSIAIASDLEAARHLAIPPFPVTWFEIDNIARLHRLKELGVKLTKIAASADVIPKCGWLIVQNQNDYSATYVGEFNDGIFVAPTSFHWTIGKNNLGMSPVKINQQLVHSEEVKGTFNNVQRLSNKILFGVADANTDFFHAIFGPTSFQSERFGKQENELMIELWGELRHIWGLLIALGTATAEIGESTKHQGPSIMAKGKPLLPLEHKVLKIHLGKKRSSIQKIVDVALHGVRKRRHDVRAHTRLLKSGRRVPVESHERGDESLGRITKTYKVEK